MRNADIVLNFNEEENAKYQKIKDFLQVENLVLLSMALSIADDSTSEEKTGQAVAHISRTTLNRPENINNINFMYQTFIISTETIKIDEITRRNIAFNPDFESDKVKSRAKTVSSMTNYGVRKLIDNYYSDNFIDFVHKLKGLVKTKEDLIKNALSEYDYDDLF